MSIIDMHAASYENWKSPIPSHPPTALPITTPEPIITDKATSCPHVAERLRSEARRRGAYDYEVKSWPWFFEPMCAGNKRHDMRDKRDRNYKIGDRMLLREYDPRNGQYTGREAIARITYITDNVTPCAMSSNALDNDACILSVDVVEIGEMVGNA